MFSLHSSQGITPLLKSKCNGIDHSMQPPSSVFDNNYKVFTDVENYFKYFLTSICTIGYRYLNKSKGLSFSNISNIKPKNNLSYKNNQELIFIVCMFDQLSEGRFAALLTGRVDRRFLSSPKVFIRTFTSESESNWNNCSVLRPRKMSDLIFCSA